MRKIVARATVHVLIETEQTETEAEAELWVADAMTALLTDQMQKYVPTSSLIDWCYAAPDKPVDWVAIPEEYEPDADMFPRPELTLSFEAVLDAALALSRDEQFRLCRELDIALGSFTMVCIDVERFLEDIDNGYFEDFGILPYSLSWKDAHGALYDVNRKGSAPEDYESGCFEWACQMLRDDGYCPELVPMWCAGLGG